MSTDITVPQLPESVSDATVASWTKKKGDSVKRDEVLVELETDKVVLEVPAPADGVLEEVLQDEGATVTAVTRAAAGPVRRPRNATTVMTTPRRPARRMPRPVRPRAS